MAPGSSAERGFGRAEREALLALARASIRAGLDGERLRVEVEDFAPALTQPHASTSATAARAHDLRVAPDMGASYRASRGACAPRARAGGPR